MITTILLRRLQWISANILIIIIYNETGFN